LDALAARVTELEEANERIRGQVRRLSEWNAEEVLRRTELEEALRRADRVFEAMGAFAERFLDDNPEGRIGVLSRRIVQHSREARDLIALAAAGEGDAT
jgi:hypothetical protein